LLGPTIIAVRPFKDAQESFDATMSALQGMQLSFRPDLWQPYADARMRVLLAAKPAATLKQRFPDKATLIEEAIAQTGKPEASLMSLPLVGRDIFWTVLLDGSNADVVGYIALDSF
jgi:hypothetical protein